LVRAEIKLDNETKKNYPHGVALLIGNSKARTLVAKESNHKDGKAIDATWRQRSQKNPTLDAKVDAIAKTCGLERRHKLNDWVHFECINTNCSQ
jgi:hypothetical protein